jgi:hypothetical protein
VKYYEDKWQNGFKAIEEERTQILRKEKETQLKWLQVF